MSLLVLVPVIRPPEPAILNSWDHRPHLCVVNGHHDQWAYTCQRHGIEYVLSEVDGQPYNARCAASWNLGFRHAKASGIDHVAIMSQSLHILSGTSRLAELVAERADDRGMGTNYSFHCAVFSVALWERVGGFDEELPVICDMDFVKRLHDAGERTTDNPMPGVGGLRMLATTSRAAAVATGEVSAWDYILDYDRYIAKWGRFPRDPLTSRG